MVQLIRFADCEVTPWKNGAGTTRQLWQKRDVDGALLIRISIAEVKGDQVFSRFAGMDRIIMALQGPDMVLTLDGVETPLKHYQPLSFPGEARVTCHLADSGAAQDLNLMCQRLAYQPVLKLWKAVSGEAIRVEPHFGVTAFLALQPCEVITPQRLSLVRYDLLLSERCEVFQIHSANALFALLEAVAVDVKADRA